MFVTGVLLHTYSKLLSKLKCYVQVQAGKAPGSGQTVYAGPIDCGRQLLKSGGISSLYRGLGATFIRGAVILATIVTKNTTL